MQCSKVETTCASFEYSFDCIRKNNGKCTESNYDGNGKIKLSEGTYEYDKNIFVEDAFLMIEGAAIEKTKLIHDSNISCVSHQCFLFLSNLSFIASGDSFIISESGGQLIFDHVHFESNGLLHFTVSNNATMQFTDCVFSD